MRGLRYAVRIALVIMLALPGAALAQGMVVTPGLGVGPWTLDKKLTDYVWASGDVNLLNGDKVPLGDVRASGTDVEFSPQLAEESWQTPNQIYVLYPGASNLVWAVGTAEPAAETVEHVGVGSTQDQVTAAYQAPQFTQQLPARSRTLIYDARGVAFEFDYAASTGRYATGVGRVWVFRPGQARAIWRLP